MTSFTLNESALVGLVVGASGGVTLNHGTVKNNVIGVSVQNEALPLQCLENRVLWIDNDVNLDGATLSIPEPLLDLYPDSPGQPLPVSNEPLPEECPNVFFSRSWCAVDD